jgi:hypothetical protein
MLNTPNTLSANPNTPTKPVFNTTLGEDFLSGGTASMLTLATFELCANTVTTSCCRLNKVL